MIAEKLGEILVAKKAITNEDLTRAIRVQSGTDRSLGEVLTDMGCASPEEVAKALAAQFNIPYYELDEEFRIEQEEIQLLPEAMARRFCLIPVKKDAGETMTIVMRDPLDLDAVDAVRSKTGLEVHKAVSTEQKIRETIDKFYTEEAHIERNIRDIVELEGLGDSDFALGADVDPDQLMLLANDAPVVRFVNLLLMQAVRDGASDIHFEPGENDVTVRLRVDGVLREVTPPPKHLYQAIVTRIKILSEMDIAERRLPLDGRFKFKFQDHSVDIRVSSLPEVHGEKLVLRVLDQTSLIVDMQDLGFEKSMMDRFQQILSMPHGIILLTGPTGSGKTTTLYSALNHLRSPERNIQTVEDPVEYLIPGVNQMATRDKVGLDFARSLRSILRQDPDIIMIGEVRDVETARIAIRAALTGHLVLSTLHTNDAPSAFSRLRDIGLEGYLTAATVNLVISQRLVRKICPHCSIPMTPSPDQLRLVTSVRPDAQDWTFRVGAGCEQCSHSGYRGRTAVLEFLEVTDPIRSLVLNSAGDSLIRDKALEQGMEPLAENGLKKVEQGITTLQEIVRVWPLMVYA